MSRGSRPVRAQIKQILAPMRRRSASRHDDKYQHRSPSGIYSDTTYKVYVQQCSKFAYWVESSYGVHKVAEMAPYAKEYIDTLPSAWSQKTALSAMRKLYGADSLKDVQTASRSRDTISRSRQKSDYTEHHYSEAKHTADTDLMAHLGLRRSEYPQLRGGMVTQKEDGHYYVCGIHGKGGKLRDVRILGDDSATIARIQATPAGEAVIPHISAACPVHAIRAEYACNLYKEIARPITPDGQAPLSGDCPKGELYYCRNDKQGTVYDRSAMKVVSESMGHNRVSVIAENYLWKL